MGSLSLTEIIIMVILLTLKVVFFGAVVYGAIYVYNRVNKVKE